MVAFAHSAYHFLIWTVTLQTPCVKLLLKEYGTGPRPGLKTGENPKTKMAPIEHKEMRWNLLELPPYGNLHNGSQSSQSSQRIFFERRESLDVLPSSPHDRTCLVLKINMLFIPRGRRQLTCSADSAERSTPFAHTNCRKDQSESEASTDGFSGFWNVWSGCKVLYQHQKAEYLLRMLPSVKFFWKS